MNYEELIKKIPDSEKPELLRLLRALDEAKTAEAARENFLDFVKAMWPGFISGRHHKIMADAFERVASGKLKRLIINMPPRHTKPLNVNEMVTMGDGTEKRLGDICVGDSVLTHMGRARKVLAVHEQGVIPTIQITLANGATINSAPDHPFLTDKGWVKAEDLNGCRVKLSPEESRIGGPVDEFSLAGYLIGDGSIGLCNNGKGQKSSITMADDVQIVSFTELCERMGITLRRGSSKYEWHLSGGYTQMATGTKNNYVRNNNFAVREWLRENDMVHSSSKKIVPDFVKRGTRDQIAAFLGSYFACDGTVANRLKYRGVRFGYTTISKQLAEEVLRLLHRLGIYWNIRETKTQVVYKGERKFGVAWSVDTQGFGEARKFFNIVGPHIHNSKRSRMEAELSRATANVKIGDGFSRVKSIVTTPDAECRCLEVEEDHTFICAGMVVHNSEFASYLFPAWYLGKYPDRKIIQTSHTAELAVGFGRKVRNIVDTEKYKKIFSDVQLRADSKAAGRWSTNKGSEYYALGIGGSVTGKGADLLIIDDPHALTLDTLVPTPNGFVTIADLKIGDEVFGPDGKPTKVVAKSDVWKDRELYKFRTDDGEEILCDGGHLWPYMSDTSIKKSKLRNATARDLSSWWKKNRPCLPRHSPVEFPERELPIDPYILGAWLGDGTSSLGRMTAHMSDQEFMRGQFDAAGYETTDQVDIYNFGVLKLRRQLIDLGVLNNKHIPEIYMTASVEQRKALLQGLMDTDGCASKAGQCQFTNTNKKLADGVRELVHSLGIKAAINQYKYGEFDRDLYTVNFKYAEAFRMPRKKERAYTPTDKRRRTFDIQKTELRGDVQCITVEREDGLFLVGRGYVVTHNSEQEAMIAQYDPSVYDKVYSWFSSGARQRLQPGGAIVVVMTRWGLRDLTGQLIKDSTTKEGASEWEVIELPAIMPSGDPLWPEFWSIEELNSLKAELPVAKWNAQYQQDPTSEAGALIKRDWWLQWQSEKAPACDAVIVAMDTAFSKTERSDYSACVCFGVFNHPNESGKLVPNLILLDAWKEKLEFPELKAAALQYYKDWQPDMFIVEKKASGAPLIAELRSAGIPVQEFTPTRATGDKIVRVNAITDIFASGVVWAPDERFAEEVVEECAAFPSGDHDDYVDAVTMALMRFRQGGFMIPTDEEDTVQLPVFRKEPFY